MFGPKVLEEFNSPYSGNIRLIQTWGYKYVATAGLTQSGGLVRDVWKPILKKLAHNHKLKPTSWLILGLATGSVADMIAHKFHPQKIVGVELDPIMLDLGRRHFGLDQIPNLHVIQADAKSYVHRSRTSFDVILVDLYLGDRLPDFVYSDPFISRLKKLGQTIVINHLFYDDSKKLTAEGLVKKLDQVFSHIELVRTLTNLMIIAS